MAEEKHERPPGFLPIHTNMFDRVFISIVVLVALHLIWFRFLESFFSVHIATILSLALAYVIVRWG
jgi:predicted small integral membrane protein